MKWKSIQLGSGLLAVLMTPGVVHACACGCNIFTVGGSTMLPTETGGMAFMNFDYMNQNRDWNGASKGDPDNNDDKRLQSEFTSIGAQYLFNSSWGIEGELPYTFRIFKGTDGNGNISTHNWSGVGDIRLNAIYTGFADDFSTGLTLGVKLPTGNFDEDTFLVDRDTQIGSGSTDLLLGAFHRDKIGRKSHFEWFVQGLLDVPLLTQGEYTPGTEFDGAIGIDYTGFSVGGVLIVPVAQVYVSDRAHDSGNNADPFNTGYQRVMLSPGLEVDYHRWRFYVDTEIPVYQYFKGNQLSAPALFKSNLTFLF